MPELPAWAQKRHSDQVRANQTRSFAMEYQELYEEHCAMREALEQVIEKVNRGAKPTGAIKAFVERLKNL